VTLEITDGVAVVTMANPPANLFDNELSAGLVRALRDARDNAGVRALLLRADGAQFSGGADVGLFKDTSPTAARPLLTEGLELIETIESTPYPVIAAVRGLCIAAGLELALACDLIVAAEGSRFAQVEAKIGAATFLGGAYRLAQRAGLARAFEITFTGEFFDAVTFERWNIINRVVPVDQLDEISLAWARQLANGPTAAHAVTKKIVHFATDHGVRAADRYVLEAATPLFGSRDMQFAVGLLLEQGAREFMANHSTVLFDGN
jgi:enoyl-CoA hydratase/carnithine racemase